MTYNIKPCPKSGEAESPSPGEPTFSVRVEGPFILFEDMIRANCCPGKLELNMVREGNVIRLYEAEHFEMPCPCECDYPTDARLGPFENGSYTVEVYRQIFSSLGEWISENLKGSAEVVIELE